ncbi:ZIP family metal transporter [Streptomyces sp. WELS2]|uniref:ZIP family metal transporter n=1 Tax=Streptomyces sp. WELS2 TaxID=2749435 RepID=UPI0015F01442|nr:ZIP family metal transporter [Streptomyces sp. WELS2]
MAVFVALGAFLMTLAGGWTAQRVTDRRHLVLGLAGGLMLGVVGLDLLPEALRAADSEIHGVPAALLLFVAGFLLAHLVERLLAARRTAHGAVEHAVVQRGVSEQAVVQRGAGGHGTVDHDAAGRGPVGHDAAGPRPVGHDAPGHDAAGPAEVDHDTPGHRYRSPEVGLTAAAAMVGHSLMDGVAIGASFQVGGGMGAAVALAVIAHDFADGFNTFTLTRLYGNARRKALAMLFADAVAPVAGAAASVFLTIPEDVLGGYLGLFGGVLLYLAAAEILPEAHHAHPARSTLLCTVAGAAFIWLVVGVTG